MAGDLSEMETLAESSTLPTTELGLGDVFAGRYTVERCLGRGSMGTVYAAHDRVVDDTVALKLLSLREDASIDAFRREVRLARRVTHRNTARTFDLGLHRGVHFITMELIEGESLRVKLAREGRLSPLETVDTGRQLALGLQAAHDVGVIHRDLKPANILVDESGRVVITDFGVASTTAEEAAGTSSHRRMIGTPMYMAPEQVEGAPIDARVDVYSLGVVLYELLTGKSAFDGESRVAIAMARLTRPPPDPRKTAELPDELAELVMRCMARSPAHRPERPSVVASELATIESTLTPISSTGGLVSDVGTPFAPTSPGDRALAIMPFRYRGPAEEDYLAEVLTDELVDLLAMTRGMKVSSSGAASTFKDERDARTVGRALGVDAIIEGSVFRTSDRIRITTRLIDVDTGFQRSTERFEGGLEDVFDLQDRMAKRVAESLRVELSILDHGRRAPPEAVELYLRGRKRSRQPDLSGRSLDDAVQLYDRCLALSPGFAPALAARAEAIVRRWFLPSTPRGWLERAEAVVRGALEGASHLAETHIAMARLEVSRGQFASAARHLTTALEIAPTCAPAHEYLGLLQCEAGRSREGVRHIELAQELDPSLHQGAFSVLRNHALRGRRSAFDAYLDQMKRSPRFLPFALSLFEFRLELWFGEEERARAVRWRTDPDPASASARMATLMTDALDPVHSHDEIAERFGQVVESLASPRLRTGWRQIATEVLAWRGAPEHALKQIELGDRGGVLLDTDWFESCPLLAPLRDDARFLAKLDVISERADAIWRTAG